MYNVSTDVKNLRVENQTAAALLGSLSYVKETVPVQYDTVQYTTVQYRWPHGMQEKKFSRCLEGLLPCDAWMSGIGRAARGERKYRGSGDVVRVRYYLETGTPVATCLVEEFAGWVELGLKKRTDS